MPHTETGKTNSRRRTGNLVKAWRRCVSRCRHAVVHVSPEFARAGGAACWREGGRSDLHEQPYGEPSPDDGDVLSANEIALQTPDGRSGVPFRYLRDQDTDHSSWARPERRACSGTPAKR